MASLFNRAPHTYSVLFSITGIDALTFALNVLSIKMFALFKSL